MNPVPRYSIVVETFWSRFQVLLGSEILISNLILCLHAATFAAGIASYNMDAEETSVLQELTRWADPFLYSPLNSGSMSGLWAAVVSKYAVSAIFWLIVMANCRMLLCGLTDDNLSIFLPYSLLRMFILINELVYMVFALVEHEEKDIWIAPMPLIVLLVAHLVHGLVALAVVLSAVNFMRQKRKSSMVQRHAIMDPRGSDPRGSTVDPRGSTANPRGST